MSARRLLLFGCVALLMALGRAAEANPFFAMNTIAKGPPEAVVPLLKELGYAGLGGAAGDRAMAEALQREGLTFFNGYLTITLQLDAGGVPQAVAPLVDAMRGLGTTLWLAVTKIERGGKAVDLREPANEEALSARLREMADYAAARGVKIALYPHTGQAFAHFEDAVRMVERVNHPALGVTFNLCHWLKVEGNERDPEPLLKAAVPRLMFVTINGADAGETKTMRWDRLIQPLGEGSYDVAGFLRKLRGIGYAGPIGFQGFGIKGEPRDVLAKTMAAWKKIQAGAGTVSAAEKALEQPRSLPRVEELGRPSRNNYGSLEGPIELMRAHRPLDLSAGPWRQAHRGGTQAEWAQQARQVLSDGLHYDPGKLALNARTLGRWETDTFVRETIEFNTAPWFRVPGYFYTPKNVPLPAPALVVFHEWGGPMLFGADRVSGEPVHPIIVQHRKEYTSGRAIADWFASHGYAVIVIDAYHFGGRTPRGLNGLPESFDATKLDEATMKRYDALTRDQLYLGVRQLNWAGTTWAGVNYGDDSRCIDYLLTRKEVDPERIGCTGLSGGGWRTNILTALEPRIKAAVSVGWTTTGDAQQLYNLSGAIGTFCLLPGVWNRIDVPDLMAMAAPKAVMVVVGTEDPLFPPLGMREATKQIAGAYAWAGVPERFRSFTPAKPHCYDAEIQEQALAWFDAHLKKK